jgi:protein-L-isoaspartate(D-aspartate) O-methyltransferase
MMSLTSASSMSIAAKYQQELLAKTQSIYHETPISEATQQAYLATPRHLFVRRYREWGLAQWQEVDRANLSEHLVKLYTDRPLILVGDDDNDIPSTISQPSFVLRMLDLLQIVPGQTVFELGAGSGWNAALMGHLVGAKGHVYSLEIIPEVAQTAREILATLKIENVRIVTADGGDGYASDTLYDRAIFTAGAYDLPSHFHRQMRAGGLLLVVLKNQGGGDNLFLLRKQADCFESIDSMGCGFVQLKGKYQFASLEPIEIETLPEWAALQHQEVARMPFWWGGKGKYSFLGHTIGIQGFLSISERSFQAFKTERISPQSRSDLYFGLWLAEERSLVIARDDLLIAYGNKTALDRLLQKVKEWVDLGMPSAASFALKVYPIDFPLTADRHEWIVKRQDSQFLWSLNS